MTLIDDAVLDDLFMVQPIAEPTPTEPTDLFTAHTRQCATCGAAFQTCGKGKRCSSCLVGPGVASKEARITCRVCGAGDMVALDWPALLCELCMGDLDGTRERVAQWLAAALARLDANQAQWQEAIRTSNAAEKWPAIQGALIAVAEKRATPGALAATWAKRKAEGGALAELLGDYEAYAEEGDRLTEELGKLHEAQREINQAFLATEI